LDADERRFIDFKFKEEAIRVIVSLKRGKPATRRLAK
jgi:hypothetical protein